MTEDDGDTDDEVDDVDEAEKGFQEVWIDNQYFIYLKFNLNNLPNMQLEELPNCSPLFNEHEIQMQMQMSMKEMILCLFSKWCEILEVTKSHVEILYVPSQENDLPYYEIEIVCQHLQKKDAVHQTIY